MSALADLAGHLTRDLSVGWTSHHGQGRGDSAVRKNIEKRRLAQRDGKCLLQSVIEYWLARGVRDVGEHNRVPFVELGCLRRASVRQTKDDRSQQSEEDEAKSGARSSIDSFREQPFRVLVLRCS